jgi:hypothetical protein
MKRLTYLLILLLLSGQVDGVLAVDPVLASALLTDDNDDDEYLPVQQRPRDEEAVVHKKPAFVGLSIQTATVSHARWGLRSEWNLPTSLGTPFLYVFMSLQI